MRHIIKQTLKRIDKITSEQAQELLKRAAFEIDRLESALDSLNDGVLVCDTQHHLTLANKYAERVFPVNYEYGPVWAKIKNEKVKAFFEKTLTSGDKVEKHEFDIEIQGISRLFSISILPLVSEHHVCGSLIFIEDITERHNREMRLRRAESLASLTTLAAGVAHEIKNPLGSLSIHTQLIQKTIEMNRGLFQTLSNRKKVREDANAYFNLMDRHLGIVNEEIARLNHIVVDFLFAVQPVPMDIRLGNINTFIEEFVQFVSLEMEKAHIEYCLDLAKELPSIEFDEHQMKQAFLNLIKNAISAMPDGGCLRINTSATETDVVISVSDSGVGIPEKNLSKIFEPYFTTKDTGSGLGLTVVFKIVREHRGEISVKSKNGEGSTFIITIPIPIPQKDRRLIGHESILPFKTLEGNIQEDIRDAVRNALVAPQIAQNTAYFAKENMPEKSCTEGSTNVEYGPGGAYEI
ncbi:MAG: PAS domain-containing sensor histidine kinase [Treponema sp.]|nr:PAS domain-containing sensor histidine kinase [Treponema sp.]